MKRTEVLQEIRRMRFEEIYSNRKERGLTVEQAAELLGVHVRTFCRWSRRYESEGAEGLYDKRLGKMANNAAPVDEVISILNLFETKYSNFNVAHFYDKYREWHEGERSYTWVKNHLQKSGLVKKAKKKGAHRRKRPRAPMAGMMLHQDGSDHEWVPNIKWDLIVTMDDSNNEIYLAFFVAEEGTWSSFRGVKEVIEEYGLFCSLYTDRGSHYWHTPEVGGKVDKNNLTQFGRAMRELNIRMIPAYSPEARGRSERMFKTLQDRLPKELQLAGITDMEKANKFLKETFIPAFNKRFMAKPEHEEKAFVSWSNSLDLDDILCVKEQRIVAKDNTVSYKNKTLQIPKDNYRYHYVKAQVYVHEYMDGTLGLFHGPRLLGKYDKNGDLMSDQNKELAVC